MRSPRVRDHSSRLHSHPPTILLLMMAAATTDGIPLKTHLLLQNSKRSPPRGSEPALDVRKSRVPVSNKNFCPFSSFFSYLALVSGWKSQFDKPLAGACARRRHHHRGSRLRKEQFEFLISHYGIGNRRRVAATATHQLSTTTSKMHNFWSTMGREFLFCCIPFQVQGSRFVVALALSKCQVPHHMNGLFPPQNLALFASLHTLY